jgi:hypothetical protein
MMAERAPIEIGVKALRLPAEKDRMKNLELSGGPDLTYDE